jgi:alkylhydroperoxidase family enzyme
VGALDAIEWEACLLEPLRDADAERQLRKELGSLPPAARYFADPPWVTRAAARLDIALPTRHLAPELVEMIALVVSQDNACRYCYEATRLLMKVLGFPDRRIRRLEEDLLGGELSAAEQAALQFARCISRATPLATCESGRPLLDAGFSIEAVKEVAVLAATNTFLNRLSTLPALPPSDWDFGRRWYMRLLRPLIARQLRPRRATAPVHLRATERTGPFAPIVVALDGLPVAPRLRAIIDDAWGSPVLPRRTKALVFAVVARGIGCPRSECEAVELLVETGLTRERVADALAHLGSPDLGPAESAAASLARESIWYQPALVQRHARAVRDAFTRQEFVELIGLAALANMLCRLSVITELGAPAQ